MDYREMRHYRLDILEEWLSEGILVSWRDVPRTLLEAGIVSRFYTVRNLEMDIWYLRRGYICPSSDEDHHSRDVFVRLQFRIIVRSLLDLRSGRPCDLGVWSKDIPSDFTCCTNEVHLCWPRAEEYLLGIDEEAETRCGLPAGKLRSIVKTIKADPIFRIGSALTSELPCSFSAAKPTVSSLFTRNSVPS